MAVALEELLDLVRARREVGDLAPVRPLPGPAADETAAAVVRVLGDPYLRPEHRARIYADLEKNRALLLERHEPRLVDLVYWSEHVDSLYRKLRGGALQTFYYVRALEATCRRCSFDLLPAMGRMEELGRAWSTGDFAGTLAILVPPPTDAGDDAAPQANV